MVFELCFGAFTKEFGLCLGFLAQRGLSVIPEPLGSHLSLWEWGDSWWVPIAWWGLVMPERPMVQSERWGFEPRDTSPTSLTSGERGARDWAQSGGQNSCRNWALQLRGLPASEHRKVLSPVPGREGTESRCLAPSKISPLVSLHLAVLDLYPL